MIDVREFNLFDNRRLISAMAMKNDRGRARFAFFDFHPLFGANSAAFAGINFRTIVTIEKVNIVLMPAQIPLLLTIIIGGFRETVREHIVKCRTKDLYHTKKSRFNILIFHEKTLFKQICIVYLDLVACKTIYDVTSSNRAPVGSRLPRF